MGMMKIKTSLLCTTALALAAVGAGVSLSGLVTMFGAAFLPVGAGLEIGKLSGAAALHRCWGTLSRGIRYTLSGVVGALMVLTSAGIYGFAYEHYLAHVAAATAPAIERSAAVEAKILRTEDQLASLSARMAALDAAPAIEVAQAKGARTAAAIAASARAMSEASKLRLAEDGRRRAERAELTKDREARSMELTALREEQARASSEVRASEAEVGPVRVVAEVLGVDPGKVVAASVASIYDLLCVLLLLVASHESSMKTEPKVETLTLPKKSSRSEASKKGWATRRRKAVAAARRTRPALVKS